VTITFDAQNWNPAHGELLNMLADHARVTDTPIAEYIGRAIALKGMDIHRSEVAFDAVMDTCEKLAAEKNKEQIPPGSIDSDMPEP